MVGIYLQVASEAVQVALWTKFAASGAGYETGRPRRRGGRCGRVVATAAALAYRLATTSTSALRVPAAGGAFEVAVEALFLSSSRAVETPG